MTSYLVEYEFATSNSQQRTSEVLGQSRPMVCCAVLLAAYLGQCTVMPMGLLLQGTYYAISFQPTYSCMRPYRQTSLHAFDAVKSCITKHQLVLGMDM